MLCFPSQTRFLDTSARQLFFFALAGHSSRIGVVAPKEVEEVEEDEVEVWRITVDFGSPPSNRPWMVRDTIIDNWGKGMALPKPLICSWRAERTLALRPS